MKTLLLKQNFQFSVVSLGLLIKIKHVFTGSDFSE